MSSAITPVELFRVAPEMQVELEPDTGFNSLVEAFTAASKNAEAQSQDISAMASTGELSGTGMIDIMMGMSKLKQNAMLTTHLVTEATKGFKTLIQQS